MEQRDQRPLPLGEQPMWSWPERYPAGTTSPASSGELEPASPGSAESDQDADEGGGSAAVATTKFQLIRATAAAIGTALVSLLASTGFDVSPELREAIAGLVASVVVLLLMLKGRGGNA